MKMNNPPDDKRDGQLQSQSAGEIEATQDTEVSTIPASPGEDNPLLRRGQVPYQTGFGQKPVEVYLKSQRSDGESTINDINKSGDHWYRHIRVWGIILAVLLLCLILINPEGRLSKPSTSTGSTQSTTRTSPPKMIQFDLQTLVGMKWGEARRVLSDHNWTRADYRLDTEDGEVTDAESNWIVTAVSDQSKPLISLRHDAEDARPGQTDQDPNPELPEDYKSALAKADEYSRFEYMSRRAIYETLTDDEGDKYSPQAAQYAVDHLHADYRENALACAKEYQKYLKMTPEEIHKQLMSTADMFTSDEADYAIQHLQD